MYGIPGRSKRLGLPKNLFGVQRRGINLFLPTLKQETAAKDALKCIVHNSTTPKINNLLNLPQETMISEFQKLAEKKRNSKSGAFNTR